VPKPEPGPGELLVRNFATALNRADLLQRRGLYPPPRGASDILGLEFAGEVAQVGPEVTGFERGQPVFGLVPGGGYAEFLTVDHRLALPVPENLSYDAAAAVPEAFYVAYDALYSLGHLPPDGSALVHAGASGVGTAAIQLVRAFGGQVMATAGSSEKVERCLALGAACAVNYRNEDFAARVAEWTSSRGVDVVLDLVGARHVEGSLNSLRRGGRLVVVGLVGGSRAEVDLGLLLRQRLTVIGTVMRSRPLEERVQVTRDFRDKVLPHLVVGRIEPVIDRVLPLEEAAKAHECMEANENVGKIVLRM
jgi:tumor protein p53-inducible protein 3